MGCDNQPSGKHAAVMFDNYFEYGGNTFDTAHIYGGGRMEQFLGGWMKNRGVVREDVVVIGKGAHTPANFPDRVAPRARHNPATLCRAITWISISYTATTRTCRWTSGSTP